MVTMNFDVYVPVQWKGATYTEILEKINCVFRRLRTFSCDTIPFDRKKLGYELTLRLSRRVIDYLSVVNDSGVSVRSFLATKFPAMVVVPSEDLDDSFIVSARNFILH